MMKGGSIILDALNSIDYLSLVLVRLVAVSRRGSTLL